MLFAFTVPKPADRAARGLADQVVVLAGDQLAAAVRTCAQFTERDDVVENARIYAAESPVAVQSIERLARDVVSVNFALDLGCEPRPTLSVSVCDRGHFTLRKVVRRACQNLAAELRTVEDELNAKRRMSELQDPGLRFGI